MRLPERVLQDLASTTRFTDVRLLDRIDSTNRVAVEAAAAGAPEGLVVAADHQTQGRGRLGRRWDAPPGMALLVSVLLRPAGLPPERSQLVTAAVALAAADACGLVAGFTPELKWPNDLLVGDRKLAGVLAERAGDAVVAGIGLNVRAAPPGAAAAEEVAGHPVAREDLLVTLLRGLDRRCGRWDEVAAEYRRRLATVGRRVRVDGPPGGPLVGTATGVDPDGRLLVAVGSGAAAPVAVFAGDVLHLRPAAAGAPDPPDAGAPDPPAAGGKPDPPDAGEPGKPDPPAGAAAGAGDR